MFIGTIHTKILLIFSFAFIKMSLENLPIFDTSPFIHFVVLKAKAEREDKEYLAFCKSLSECLRETGCILVRDSRVDMKDNDSFINLMERYYSQNRETKLKDARPDLFYQVGVTPDGIERPRSFQDHTITNPNKFSIGNEPVRPEGPDPKWRFMWRVGGQPEKTIFPSLNSNPIIPEGFPEWQEEMNAWGTKMMAVIEVVAECLAIGLGLPSGIFAEFLKSGPHLLAPTGTDLGEHGVLGKCIAGFHYDLNFLTIHGKSRFPGLRIWFKDGRRVPVRVPEGCLLIQAGKQIEWLTGGFITSGMHEVVCGEETMKAIEEAKRQGKCLWRVSSTLFSHVASDKVLEPLGHFSTIETLAAYPPMTAGTYVTEELNIIKLNK